MMQAQRLGWRMAVHETQSTPSSRQNAAGNQLGQRRHMHAAPPMSLNISSNSPAEYLIKMLQF